MEIYLVGGAVRDQLLGLPVKEKDWVVVGATPQHMQQLGFKPVGKDFPVFLHPQTHEEYALARTERKQGRGYKGFTFYYDENLSLEEDLVRRDLTINAMAMDSQGHLIDPYGGYQDLQNKVLRHVSAAFTEDPLRVLRVARLMAQLAPFGFYIHDETQQLLKTMVNSGELHALTPERVWKECERALSTTDPSAFLRALKTCGALTALFPELAEIHDLERKLLNFDKSFEGCTPAFVLLYQKLSNTIADELPKIRFAYIMYLLSYDTNASTQATALQTFCQQWPIAKSYREFASLVIQHSPSIATLPITAAAIVHFFQQTDAFRRPNRFVQFLMVCQSMQHADLPKYSIASSANAVHVLLNAFIVLSHVDLKKSIDFNQVTNFPEIIFRTRCDILEKWLKKNII